MPREWIILPQGRPLIILKLLQLHHKTVTRMASNVSIGPQSVYQMFKVFDLEQQISLGATNF